LILTTSTTIQATHAEAAYDTVKARMEQGAFGVLVWDVEQCQVEIEDWQEDSNDLALTTVEEEP
jgi:hypothetical protein